MRDIESHLMEPDAMDDLFTLFNEIQVSLLMTATPPTTATIIARFKRARLEHQSTEDLRLHEL
jgi:hypothetical protein